MWSRARRHLMLDSTTSDVTHTKRANADRLEKVDQFSKKVPDSEIKDILQKASGNNLDNEQRLDLTNGCHQSP